MSHISRIYNMLFELNHNNKKYQKNTDTNLSFTQKNNLNQPENLNDYHFQQAGLGQVLGVSLVAGVFLGVLFGLIERYQSNTSAKVSGKILIKCDPERRAFEQVLIF